jgi:hypothetical protein
MPDCWLTRYATCASRSMPWPGPRTSIAEASASPNLTASRNRPAAAHP